tara:strand:- start:196 stop:327 length:132 start_codon:yes stop_codon:yes gene_type:complete
MIQLQMEIHVEHLSNKVLQLTHYSALFQSADIFTLPKRAVTGS